jgi:hypothetical protein
MKRKNPPRPRPAKRPAAPATEAPVEDDAGADEAVERQRPSADDVQRADERAEGSIESVVEGGADGGVDATLDEDATRPRGP